MDKAKLLYRIEDLEEELNEKLPKDFNELYYQIGVAYVKGDLEEAEWLKKDFEEGELK